LKVEINIKCTEDGQIIFTNKSFYYCTNVVINETYQFDEIECTTIITIFTITSTTIFNYIRYIIFQFIFDISFLMKTSFTVVLMTTEKMLF